MSWIPSYRNLNTDFPILFIVRQSDQLVMNFAQTRINGKDTNGFNWTSILYKQMGERALIVGSSLYKTSENQYFMKVVSSRYCKPFIDIYE